MKKLYSTLVMAAVVAMSLQFSACDDAAKKAAELAEKNKAVCLKSVDVMNEGKLEALDSIFAADYVEHTPDPSVQSTGLAGIKESYKMMMTAYPDVKITVNHAVAEGDKVMLHMTFTGTNTGPMGDMPATGKPVKADGTEVFIVKDGKISEHWAVYDSFSMMMQMGFTMVPMEGAEADSAGAPVDSAAHDHAGHSH